jgi:ribA/ribD-fused uncharacterized protein
MSDLTLVIAFTSVKLPFGWLGNMSPHPVRYQEREYATAEALFQILRFEDQEIRDKIQSHRSPMAAKMQAKKHRNRMIIQPRDEQDVENMRLVLRLRTEQHRDVRTMLLETGDAEIIENCSKRPTGSGLFWGAALKDGRWVGKNALGKLWMELRAEIRRGER